MHGDSSSYSARFHSQLPVQGLGALRGGQLEDHSEIHIQLRRAIRALRRSAQRRSDSRFQSLLRIGSSIFRTDSQRLHSDGAEQPDPRTLEPQGGHARPAVGFAYDVFGDGKTALRVATAYRTKGTSATSRSTSSRPTQQCHGLG